MCDWIIKLFLETRNEMNGTIKRGMKREECESWM